MGQWGHSLVQQKSLFDSIKPLFNNKPLIVVANKSDVLSRGELSEEQEALFKEMEKEVEGDILEMSTVTENGVMDVKTKACEVLLQHRVEAKYRSKKVDSILNRLHVAEPVARDNKVRTAFIPEAAIRKQQEKLAKKNDVDMDDDDYGEDEDEEENVKKPARRKTERELELEQADEYFLDLQKNYDLPEDQKYDVIPETCYKGAQ